MTVLHVTGNAVFGWTYREFGLLGPYPEDMTMDLGKVMLERLSLCFLFGVNCGEVIQNALFVDGKVFSSFLSAGHHLTFVGGFVAWWLLGGWVCRFGLFAVVLRLLQGRV